MNKIKVFAPKIWISGESCLINITDPIEHRMGNMILSKMRGDFLRSLASKGYEIIVDPEKIDDDTICLIFDPTRYDSSNGNYSLIRDCLEEKIERVAGDNYNYPFTMKITEYFQRPFFPAVFKNTLRNGGVDKFLIQSPSQLQLIKAFFLETIRNPEYALDWQFVAAQQLLESPTKYASYMRVLVSGSGEVLGSSLKYSHNVSNTVTFDGLFESAFLRPDSPFCIHSKKMFNYYAGGENISLEKPGKLTEEQKDVLRAHGIDPVDPKVPDEVLDVCRNIMLKCNREIGVICGIDFMLNRSDGKWYYLENQTMPAIDEWATANDIPMPENHDLLGYMDVLALDLKVRYEALEQTVAYRKSHTKQM